MVVDLAAAGRSDVSTCEPLAIGSDTGVKVQARFWSPDSTERETVDRHVTGDI